jgi:orotidine-5'-phosphate decarboxylase
MEPWERIIVALDVNNPHEANELVKQLKGRVGGFKLGFEFTYSTFGKLTYQKWSCALYTLSQTQMLFKNVKGLAFVDGKFMDIPNTVAGAVRAVAEMGAKMFNVHCLGGSDMMIEARKAAEETSKRLGIQKPLMLGVTILTSLKFKDLVEMRIKETHSYKNDEEKEKAEQYQMERLVKDLALLAQDCELDGVICSPKEIKIVREYCQPEFIVVTPGIRLAGDSVDDQKRVDTPMTAIKNGADFLVVGRSITKAENPVQAAIRVAQEIEEGLKNK